MANGHGGRRPGCGRKKKPKEIKPEPATAPMPEMKIERRGGPRPNSGRPKSPWRYTKDERANLAAYCREKGYDPVIRMIEMAEADDTPPGVKLECHTRVARYLHPTLAASKVEHSGRIEGDLADKSTEDLQAIADALRERRSAQE